MAKLKGKAKAAFLRRMAKGRAKAARRTTRTRAGGGTRKARKKLTLVGYAKPSTKRKGSFRLRLRQNPYALIANPARRRARRKRRNPSRSLIARYQAARRSGMGALAAFRLAKSRKRRKGTSVMAKKRKSTRKKGRARRTRRRLAAIRPSGRTRTIYINPRKRRGKRRGRAHGRRRTYRVRRRNGGRGGLMSSIKSAFTPLLAGALTGIATAALDAALAKYPTGKKLAKVGGAIAIAMFGRRYPRAACAAIGALAATEGYNIGSKLVGGMGAAQTPKQAVEGLATMAGTYPEIGALLDDGVGALLEGVPNEGQGVVNYGQALSNMAGDDDE